MKKIFAVITAVLLLVCVLSACSCGSKTETTKDGENNANGISGTWYKISDDDMEVVYVLKPEGTGYIEAYNLKFELKWEVSDGDYTFNIDATSAYENMFGMSIDEIIAANLINEESLHITESGKWTVSGEFLILMHDGVTDYLSSSKD